MLVFLWFRGTGLKIYLVGFLQTCALIKFFSDAVSLATRLVDKMLATVRLTIRDLCICPRKPFTDGGNNSYAPKYQARRLPPECCKQQPSLNEQPGCHLSGGMLAQAQKLEPRTFDRVTEPTETHHPHHAPKLAPNPGFLVPVPCGFRPTLRRWYSPCISGTYGKRILHTRRAQHTRFDHARRNPGTDGGRFSYVGSR
jgi:hypothetical protein